MSQSDLEYIIRHVFLPPHLPQADDYSASSNAALLTEVRDALVGFQSHTRVMNHSVWDGCTKMIQVMESIHGGSGGLQPENLGLALVSMVPGEFIALNIHGQNAGLIIRRRDSQYLFESFELSPKNEEVIGTTGRIRRCFPGPAVAIDHTRIRDKYFRESLIKFLVSLDSGTSKQVATEVTKARSTVREPRNTVDPRFVTEMLTGILRALGQPFDVRRIHKRTRDDVLWSDALNPWRRSPLWLLLRVAMQTSLFDSSDPAGPHFQYKSFMIFFMARVLERARACSFPDELMFIMSAKIARRVVKLEGLGESEWLEYTTSTVRSVQQDALSRWHVLESRPDPYETLSTWDASALNLIGDTCLSLENLRPYLGKVESRKRLSNENEMFDGHCSPRIFQSNAQLPNLELSHGTGLGNTRTFLADVECWVEWYLEEWLVININDKGTCAALKDVIDVYSRIAIEMYTGRPEDVSLMFLTLMDLWISLDKCAVRHYALLGDYDPGFHEELFEPLLLPQKNQMARLANIEEYLSRRRENAVEDSPSIFGPINQFNSFGVRYFNESSRHRALKQEIEADARKERSEKLLELYRMRQRQKQLVQDSAKRSCDYKTHVTRGGRATTSHDSRCQRCRLVSEARDLSIDVHEWPLPERDLEAKAVVFELDVPITISKWRDTTYGLLVDILSNKRDFEMPESSIKTKVYTLRNYSELGDYINPYIGRLQLASKNKPFTVSHYSEQKVTEADEDSICVNNGMRFMFYDPVSRNWASDLLRDSDIRKKCTYSLDSARYGALQYAVNNTTHTSNEVISRQEQCARELTLHEFYAFGTLRSGHRLQWRNIARELTAKILNFSHEEVHTLIRQSIWQAGPKDRPNECRDSHIDLEEEEFGMSLISSIDDSLRSVAENWQAATAVRTFIVLTTRLLSLNSADSDVKLSCLRVLRKAREITLRWTRELSQKLQEGQMDPAGTKMLNDRTLEMALSCYATFDVEEHNLLPLLRSTDDVATVIECSIIIHDRRPPSISGLSSSVRTLLHRHSRLSHTLERFLHANDVLYDGLNKTVTRIWAGYRPGESWATLPVPCDRWLETETSPGAGCSSMKVHYNLLDGSLLINGSPLSRLPHSYEEHPTYLRLFSEKVLEVIPSTMDNMLFETRNELFGYQVHFAMHDSELIIRTKQNGDVHELLPAHAMIYDFPQSFVNNYAHWLDTSTGLIEWRPLENPWVSSPLNWWMRWSDGQFNLAQEHSSLIDVRSATFKAVSRMLSPLERTTHRHVSLNRETGFLNVNLPRLKLEFFLRPGSMQLESKQFRGMIVDEDQSLGTFTGLFNKLVLRSINGSARGVIVPHGHISPKRRDQHVLVEIKFLKAQKHISHHFYQVDTSLGRLVDNGSLRSRLYKYYLHAMTSHCLVDKLTGKTGTEEALSGLKSASTQSFLKLESEEIKLLKLIAELTPRREFYPSNLKVMQNVTWNEGLPTLSQHPAFVQVVRSTIELAGTIHLFQDGAAELGINDLKFNVHLLERAAIREAAFRIHGFGAEGHRSDLDSIYSSRDRICTGTREIDTYSIAKKVDEWSTNLQARPSLLSEIESWQSSIIGTKQKVVLPFGYDIVWLSRPSTMLPEKWCELQRTLSKSVKEKDKYKILFLLCTMIYSGNYEKELVESLLAFATVPKLREIRSPNYKEYQIEIGYSPDRTRLINIADECCRPFNECPEGRLPRHQGETYYEFATRHNESFEFEQSRRVKTFVDGLISQWPHPRINIPGGTDCNAYIKVEEAFATQKILFESWYGNYKFREYIQQIQGVLNKLVPRTEDILGYSFSDPPENYLPKPGHISFSHITQGPAPTLPPDCSEDFHVWVSQRQEEGIDHSNVKALLKRLTSDSSSGYERQYANDLFESLDALHSGEFFDLNKSHADIRLELELYLERCRDFVLSVDQQIHDHFREESSLAQRVALASTIWPRLSATSLLRHLARDKITALNAGWRNTLVTYGISISTLQRAERLLSCVEKTPELLAELQNPGHEGWDPMEHPDWVLLEVENNILIRPVQARVAEEMISPSSGGNSIMQLNMGEGKSSVIVPIVAAALADGKRMVRVVVLKPLSSQMFHQLVRKLGGLLNRRVFHIPISRSLKLSVENATTIGAMYKECMRIGGILLVQPEHLLSFELMGFDRLLSGDSVIGNTVVGIQSWLDANSRDILDESDEILSVKFELIYTMGTQRAVEFSPDRWVVIEYVLGLASQFAEKIQEFFPEGMEVSNLSPGRFPRIRILHSDAGGKLMQMIAREICNAGVPGIPVWNLPSSVRDILFKYLTDPFITDDDILPLYNTAFAVEPMEKGLLLLKGLIAGGVLEFAFRSKRWRVNYGLDLSRTMLAVPYRAKDVPAARAEFSHPDSTIVLTCLSYYYGGLSNSQLTESFERLLLFDHAQEEYDSWVHDAPELPETYQRLTGVNLSDTEQCHQCIFPSLRFSKSAIDFYMSHIVFPKEIREFPQKLSSSGWDIAKIKHHSTTGFSGTNDSRYVLPLSIEQCDLAEQKHTNASQLACLLRPENTFFHDAQESLNESLDAEKLLKVVLESDPPVRVLLDVGAQVLELRNEELAQLWLSRAPSSEVQAAIFFDDNNELTVLSKDGVKEDLMVSPFAKQMDQCLVYLDEAHTRGTDLKLPTNYRAAVTLGPNLTKDRLVQACMRMRKLGKGQSVMFCGPIEVERSIIKCCGKSIGDPIDVSDVLRWSIQETCIHTKNCIPLWATQGTRYQRRNMAWSNSTDDTEEFFQRLAKSLLEPEAQSLETRYGLGKRSLEEDMLLGGGDGTVQNSPELDAIRQKCLQFEIRSFNSATLQEEQERELSPETEREQQVERPPPLDPLEHFITPGLEYFVENGAFRCTPEHIKRAFKLLHDHTTLSRSLEMTPWSKDLLATADFFRTVRGSPHQPTDMFLNPVRWIVSSRRGASQFIIISHFEANELLPSIREHNAVTLHVYSPRVTASTPTMEDLILFAVPPVEDSWATPHISTQLNLFAGQLYLRSYREYLALCTFLGLCSRAPSGGKIKVFSDGFVDPKDRRKVDKMMESECPFRKSPVAFLKALMTLRRKGQNFQRSHLGAISNGELLPEDRF